MPPTLSQTYLYYVPHASICRSADYSPNRREATFYSTATCRQFQEASFRDASFVVGRRTFQNPWSVSPQNFVGYSFSQRANLYSENDQLRVNAVNSILSSVLVATPGGLGVAVQSLGAQELLPAERSAQEILNLQVSERMTHCPGFTYLYVSVLNYLNLPAQVVLMPPAPGQQFGHLAAMWTTQNHGQTFHYVFDPMVNRNSVLINPPGYLTLSAREVMAWHLNNRAVNAHNENRSQEATELLNAAINLDPQNPYLYANRFLWAAVPFGANNIPNRAQLRSLFSDYHRALALKPELATELIPIRNRLQGLLRRR